MPQTEPLETDRILLRPFTESDLDALALLMGNAEVMRFSLVGAISREESAGVLSRFMATYAEHGYGMFAVQQKSVGTVVGYCGFLRQVIREQTELEIAFRLLPDIWGQGIATEAARLVRDYGLRTLGLSRLICIIDPRNHAAIHVAQHIGMTFREEYFYREDLFVHLYEVRQGSDS